MRRRSVLRAGIACLSLAAPWFRPRAARAEVMVGVGDIEPQARAASASFNDGLSTFHLMMAALDRGDIKEAERNREAAAGTLDKASDEYQETVGAAQVRSLSPIPTNSQEQRDVAYFWKHAAEYDLHGPISQKTLLIAVSRAVRSFATALQKTDVRELEKNRRAQLALFEESARLQTFLGSATTVLNLG